MYASPKIIPISRVAPVTQTSPEYVRRVINELEQAGEIQPEWTSTGRGYLNIPEWEKVRAAVAR